MQLRSFRIFLALVLPTCFILSSSALPAVTRASAASLATQRGQTFQPSRQGVATAQRMSTFTTRQVSATSPRQTSLLPHATTSAPYAQQIPPPPNVVRVPPATSTDPSANIGLADDNQNTADTNGAAGPYNYVETDMVDLGIYGRGGNLEYKTSFQQWFGKPVPYNDPLVIWDDWGSRFIISINLGFELLLSVAQQSNALGNYCNYAFPTPNNLGSDFEKLGVNSAGVFLGANLLNSSNGNFVSNEMFYINRAQLENCVSNVQYANWTDLTNPDGSLAEAITPANEENGPGNIEYMVNSVQFGGCHLTLWSLNTTSLQLTNTSIPTQCYSPPTLAPEAGTSLRMGTGQDNSLTQASYLNGLVTVALPSGYNFGDGNGTVTIIEWFVLDAANATVYKQGAFGTPGYWLFFPAAVMNGSGNMLFVYNASGPTIDPSIWYVNQTFTGTEAVAQGNSYYTAGRGAPWGYYSSAWLDKTGLSPGSVWITGEYAQSTNTWGSAFDLVTP